MRTPVKPTEDIQTFPLAEPPMVDIGELTQIHDVRELLTGNPNYKRINRFAVLFVPVATSFSEVALTPTVETPPRLTMAAYREM